MTMTVARYYYLVVSLVIIVLGAAVIARMIGTNPRTSRLITNTGGALGVALIVVWFVRLYLRTTR